MDRPNKTETAQRLFTRPQGATMDEVIAATGDYQYRALKRLQSRGYRITRAKEGRGTRYWAVPPRGGESFEVTVGSDGKVAMPKALRERLGLRGKGKVKFTIENGDRVVVSPAYTRLADLAGILGRPKRSLTLEEMDEAIADAAVERYRRAAGGRK
jgi:AbrB family looped-hinge helix DNA binding protein